MPKLRVHAYSISLDGYAAGPRQTLQDPMGEGGEHLHTWARATPMFGGTNTGVDDDFVRAGFENIGSHILGRNMFSPSRGEWPDDGWKGWWGDEPPYHSPVFVLTHHARDPIPMAGGTTFYFVTDGIESALAQAQAAAGDQDVRLGGGASTVQQYLRAGLVDEMHIAVSPVLLRDGELLFDNLGDALGRYGYECTDFVPSEAAAHYIVRKGPHER